MNDARTNQVDELLKLVDEYRERQCREIHAAADAQARDIVAQAYRGARERLHAAVAAERRRMEERVETARVQLETEQRERSQQVTAALLEEAWGDMTQAVRARWNDAHARRQWLAALVELGLESLPRQSWEVRHPAGLDPRDRAWLEERLADATGRRPTFIADAGISAGVRLETDGACLDGTVDGILSDRTEIEALLLAEAEQR